MFDGSHGCLGVRVRCRYSVALGTKYLDVGFRYNDDPKTSYQFEKIEQATNEIDSLTSELRCYEQLVNEMDKTPDLSLCQRVSDVILRSVHNEIMAGVVNDFIVLFRITLLSLAKAGT